MTMEEKDVDDIVRNPHILKAEEAIELGFKLAGEGHKVMLMEPRPEGPLSAEDFAAFSNGWKVNKKLFKKFVIEYNQGKLYLDKEEKADLIKLHTMWGSVTAETKLEEFWDMKDFHGKLNGRFLAGQEQENQNWINYIETFQKWRLKAQYFVAETEREKLKKEK